MALLVSPDTFTKDRSHRVRHEEEVPNPGASATTKAKEAKKTARSVQPLKAALAVPSNIVAARDAPKEKPPIIQHDQPLPESAVLMVFPFEKQHVGSLGYVFALVRRDESQNGATWRILQRKCKLSTSGWQPDAL